MEFAQNWYDRAKFNNQRFEKLILLNIKDPWAGAIAGAKIDVRVRATHIINFRAMCVRLRAKNAARQK